MIAERPAWRPALPAPIRRMSLRGRLMVTTAGLFILFIWAAAFLSATVLEGQIEHLLFDQQFAATRQVAGALEQNLKDDIEGLRRAAAGLPADLSYASLQPVLAQRPLMHVAFSGGIAVIGQDGRAIADYPVVEGRRGTYYGDRDVVREALRTGQPYVGKAVIGRALKRPVIAIGVPILDAAGKPRGVMTGAIDLTARNFLGFVSDRALTGSGEYFVFSLRDRMIIAATDGKRAMTAVPPRGRNLLFDRMLDGFEGSGVAVSSEGISKLYSGVRVPTADWLVLAALKTDIAFGPIRAWQHYLYFLAALLTVLALIAVRYMVRRLLSPLEDAGRAMRQMAHGQAPLAPVPVPRDDEIGRMLGNFNDLVADRRHYEAALADSEQRFRLLVEAAPEGIFVQVRGRFAYANKATVALFGAANEAQLLGQPILDRIHPDYRGIVQERIRLMAEAGQPSPAIEEKYLRLDGGTVVVEVSAVPCRFGEDDGALVFVRDISERRELEDERSRQAQHLADLSRRLIRLQEEERRHLSAELHDSTSPNLAALSINLRSIAKELASPASRGGPAEGIGILIDDAKALLEDASASIRNICADLRPSILDYAGLVPALESYAQQFAYRTGIAVRVDCPAPMERLAPEMETTLFRIAQEALTNCAKHAQAGSVRISLVRDDWRVTLGVEDDGRGFVPDGLGRDGQRPGQGLLAMRERAEFAGGALSIDSRPGQGSRIRVDIPLAAQAAAAAIP